MDIAVLLFTMFFCFTGLPYSVRLQFVLVGIFQLDAVELLESRNLFTSPRSRTRKLLSLVGRNFSFAARTTLFFEKRQLIFGRFLDDIF